MADKLGLKTYVAETDEPLLQELQRVLLLAETDYNIFFRKLADLAVSEGSDNRTEDEWIAPVLDAYYLPKQLELDIKPDIAGWLKAYAARVQADGTPDAERKVAMNLVNPKYVLRNYMAQVAIDAADEGDNSIVWELLELLRRPYDEQPEMEKWAAKRPDWARTRPGCSMLSCSS